MRELFPGYYPLTDHDLNTLWEKGIFILDTNVLLSLYRYPKAARDDLIDILKKLSNQNRIWIPFQVALEYQRLRSGIIDTERNKYCRVKSDLGKAQKNIKNCLNQMDLKEQCYSADCEDLMKEVDGFFDELCTKMESLALKRLGASQYDELDDNYDQLTDQIDQITKGKVGPPPASQQWLNEIYKEGERRYELNIPPGYGNSNKTDGYSYGGLVFLAKYGDLILWHQIIEHIKEREDLLCVVFVTNEKGNDWWRKKGDDIICPRPELATELLSKTGISVFHMYRPDRFMSNAEKYLKARVRKKSLIQVKSVDMEAAMAINIAKKFSQVQSNLGGAFASLLSPKIIEYAAQQEKIGQVFTRALADLANSPAIKEHLTQQERAGRYVIEEARRQERALAGLSLPTYKAATEESSNLIDPDTEDEDAS